LPAGQLWILVTFWPLPYTAFDLKDKLCPQPMGQGFVVHYDLCYPGRVPQVDERHTSVVTA
jgi:hypothetical protein